MYYFKNWIISVYTATMQCIFHKISCLHGFESWKESFTFVIHAACRRTISCFFNRNSSSCQLTRNLNCFVYCWQLQFYDFYCICESMNLAHVCGFTIRVDAYLYVLKQYFFYNRKINQNLEWKKILIQNNMFQLTQLGTIK